MANSKMTQKDMFKEIIALAKEAGREDIVKFAEGRIEILSRKHSQSKKKNEANEAIKAVILGTLGEMETPVTVTELQTANTELNALSNQKVSAMLRALIQEHKVDKTIKKKTSYFALV